MGFVFQSFNLIPVLTALENVELPLLLTPLSRAKRREQARHALDIVGLSDRVDHRPKQLSGGQEQRVAIARAMAMDPSVLLCDEPTGDLDRASADQVLEILARLCAENGTTVVIVTHDPLASARAKRSLHLDKGGGGRRRGARRMTLGLLGSARSLMAHPVRMTLTTLAVLVGIFLYCFLTSIVTSLEAAVKAAASNCAWSPAR